jgi:2-methylisocitrate lyase-like PEP mutase family enzyme
MSRATAFRRLLQEPPVACLGAYDALSAKLAEAAGARALYVSGYAAAAVRTGQPDLGLMSQTEMAAHIEAICGATILPVIADADTGYGGVLSVERTVRLWERAGAAGLHVEDQMFPKRCGHVAGKELIPTDEACWKIRAACASRSDQDFFVIARTDAIAVTGLSDAIARCRAFAAAGADALFVDAPESREHLVAIAAGLRDLGRPLLFNCARTFKSPILDVAELHALGFLLTIFPIEPLLAVIATLRTTYARLIAQGSSEVVADAATFSDLNVLLGMPEAMARERSYAAA